MERGPRGRRQNLGATQLTLDAGSSVEHRTAPTLPGIATISHQRLVDTFHSRTTNAATAIMLATRTIWNPVAFPIRSSDVADSAAAQLNSGGGRK